jgi:hypothetical protein
LANDGFADLAFLMGVNDLRGVAEIGQRLRLPGGVARCRGRSSARLDGNAHAGGEREARPGRRREVGRR